MVTVRFATPADTRYMARVQVDTRRAAYQAFYPFELLARLSYEKTECAWRRNLFETPDRPGMFSLLAETDTGDVVGVLIAGPVREPDLEFTAEIYVLYVLPANQHLGVGRALVCEAARVLAAAGHRRLLIWVLENNPARAFYERNGGRLARSKTEQVDGYRLVEVGYGWDDIRRLAEIEETNHAEDE